MSSKKTSTFAASLLALISANNPVFAAPQASLTLKNSDVALCNHNNTAWTLTKVVDDVTGEPGDQTVTWTVTATRGATSGNTLQVNGYVAVQNTGSADATIGNIVVNLQRQKNIGTVNKPKWAWASASVDAADATSGDAATSANIVASASQEVPANSGGAYTISGAKGTFTENASSGSLSFTDVDANTIWAITPQQVIAPGATVNLLFTANFNNTTLNIPAGESIRAEVIVSFGGVGTRGGSGASAANIDVNGNGNIGPDEAGVRSVPTRITTTVPALEACNDEVTLTDTGVTTTGTVTVGDVTSDGAPTEAISATTSFTVTATGVNGGEEGGTIGNEATLVGESDSVSVIIGYENGITGYTPTVSVYDEFGVQIGTTGGDPIFGPVPVYYDFECCTGVDLEASDVAIIDPVGIDPPPFDGFEPGDFGTFSMGGLGGNGAPFDLLAANFATLFPSGVEVGIPGAGGFSMSFAGTDLVDIGNKQHPHIVTEALAGIYNYLPAGGPSGSLTADLTNPTSTAAGNFGGQVVALKLNVALSDGAATPAGFGDLVYNNPNNALDSLNTQTVRQILAAAEIAIGGGVLPAGYDYSTLAGLCENLNVSFDGAFEASEPSAWAVSHLSVAP